MSPFLTFFYNFFIIFWYSKDTHTFVFPYTFGQPPRQHIPIGNKVRLTLAILKKLFRLKFACFDQKLLLFLSGGRNITISTHTISFVVLLRVSEGPHRRIPGDNKSRLVLQMPTTFFELPFACFDKKSRLFLCG